MTTKQVQWRRGTQTQHEAFTGAAGEVTVDTTNDAVRVHDGVTAGGHLAAKKSDIDATNNALSAHIGNQSNPHSITPEQLGLGNVDNTSDADKPVSDATQGELNELEDRIADIAVSTGNGPYASISDGLAATSDGDVFTAYDGSRFAGYQNDNGVAVELSSFASLQDTIIPYPSRAVFEASDVPFTVTRFTVAGLSYVVDPNGTAIESANGVKGSPDGDVYPDHWAENVTPGVTDMTAAVNAAISHNVTYLRPTSYGVTNVDVQANGRGIIGAGWGSVLRRIDGTTGNTITVASADPTATTVQGITLKDFRVDCSFEFTDGAHVEISECANSNFENLFILNGFQGMRIRGLRASNLSNIQVAQGATYSGLLLGSRGMVWEDSPRLGAAFENVEVFCNNINVRQNNVGDAKCEYALEIRNADGIWFDNSHFRCGFYAQGWLNGENTDNMALCMFSNTLFDGNTLRNLLVSGSGGTRSTLHNFTGCKFLSATISCVDIAAGANVGSISFDSPVFGYNGNGVDNSVVFRIDAGDDIQIDNPQGDNISLLAGLSAISVGAGVVSASIVGGRIDVISAPVGASYSGVSAAGTSTRLTVQGVDFIGFSEALSRPISLTNTRDINFRGGNCTTDHPTKYVAGTDTEYYIKGVANNDFATIELGEILGGRLEVELDFSSAGFGIVFLETSGATSSVVSGSVATFATATAPLTGTTGTSGNLTLAIDSNGTLWVENRTGATRNVSLKLRRSIGSQTINDG